MNNETIKNSNLESSKFFIQRGISSGANFNELTTSGMRYISGTCTNAPVTTGYVYGVLCIFNGNYGYIYQLHLCIGTQEIFYRSSPNNGKDWNPWKIVSASLV